MGGFPGHSRPNPILFCAAGTGKSEVGHTDQKSDHAEKDERIYPQLGQKMRVPIIDQVHLPIADHHLYGLVLILHAAEHLLLVFWIIRFKWIQIPHTDDLSLSICHDQRYGGIGLDHS